MLARASEELRKIGVRPTNEAIAEHLGIGVRTVQRWRKLAPRDRGDVTPTSPRM
jgi:transposase